MNKKRLITISGVLISVILLYFSLKDIQFHDILHAFRRADYRLVFVPLGFIGLSTCMSALKWRFIAGGKTRFSDTFAALLIGLFVNNVLPARLGEVARGYVLSKKTGISLTFSISTVFLDRFFDLVGLLIITFLFFPKLSLPAKVSQGLHALVLLLVICILLIIVLSRKSFAKKISDGLHAFKKPFLIKFSGRILEIQDNLSRINSPLNILFYGSIGFLQWLSMSAALYFTASTLGVSIKPEYVPFVCALLNMGLTIPSSPGYIGVYQFLLVYLLSIFGIPKHEGFAVSVMFHALWYIPYNITGFSFLLKENLRFSEIRDFKKRG